ncbi:MAG: ABC transporter substrate-binding protein [Methylophaga sp.]|nr:ABC transporter substrate-binding protein [Methylophaga sp.]
MRLSLFLYIVTLFLLAGCELPAINSPYPEQASDESILYTSFSLRPKHLDPARSYSSNEVSFTGHIYEPPLQYHYLKRPYQLIPLTAESLPAIRYFNEDDIEVDVNEAVENIAYSIYEITIKPNIYYQPHPAFVKTNEQQFLYHQLTDEQLSGISTLFDFERNDTRELIAEDYVYQIKRLAHPKVHSPIVGLMGEYIVGLAEYAKQLRQYQQQKKLINLRTISFDGVKVIDRYRYQIKVVGKYPQLQYWLAMPFFAPMPWEADSFYDQQGLIDKNISLDWYPVGTGPYYLSENDPNRRMVLTKNPNYHADYYPTEGEEDDKKQGLLKDAGKRLPFIDKIVFSLEKETIPYWNKFMQGYYDISGISSDSFEQAIQMSNAGAFALSEQMEQQGIILKTAVETSIFYTGFNMRDPIVGGYGERAKKLRQAIAIAIDQEEYISIFTNGRGIAAQGPIPPGIFGYKEGEQGYNPYLYTWQQGKAKRKTIVYARSLLAEAGYPEGRAQKTGEPLLLYFDVTGSGPDSKARFDWLRKQFQKLSIQLVIRETDYNRFQDKMQTGQAQIFQWGWNADYPDPENFLFLLYGPNSKVISGGQNTSNYQNDQFDHLFEQMKVMPDNDQRQKVIEKMLAIVREDAPWVWGYHPKQFSLYHGWNNNVKPNLMANNTTKYRRVDVEQRSKLQQTWNRPILWPIILFIFISVLLVLPAWISYQNKKQQKIN